MKTVIIKYNAGNVRSVAFALERIGIEAIITDDPAEIQAADKVIFPGVGEAATAMAYLKERKLDEILVSLKQPVLGICLGMQLMCAHSEEGNTSCLGIFQQDVKLFKANALVGEANTYKVPQVGWNNLFALKTNLFTGMEEQAYMYFVHSYYVPLGAHTIATVNYGIGYSAALHKSNFYARSYYLS